MLLLGPSVEWTRGIINENEYWSIGTAQTEIKEKRNEKR